MRVFYTLFFFLFIKLGAAATISTTQVVEPRPMENLGRGVVAVRSSETDVLVTWRLLGLDPRDIKFNVYREEDKKDGQLLNAEPLGKGTNFVDPNADLSKDNTYYVRPVLHSKEQSASSSFTLKADNAEEPIVRVPINSGERIRFVWVGDLDGDGEYDYVIDRHGTQQSIEAYRSDGKFLWTVHLGPLSTNQDNISPSATTISVGHWDGVTVYDFDNSGSAQVALRIATGVRFGDGEIFDGGKDDDHQWIAILDGLTGAMRAMYPIPTTYIDTGPMVARLAVGYLDGVRPHLVGFLKNRPPGQSPFNRLMIAWTFDGDKITEEWVFDNRDAGDDGHNTRVIDVDGDGIDEVGEIDFLINGNGTLRYSLNSQGIYHGDRWHIAKIDPSREGLQGFGCQQNNEDLVTDYYYDARTGKIIWTHHGDEIHDTGRAMAGDIDPTSPGMEVWTFSGVYDAPNNNLLSHDTENYPWPFFGIWWDDDELIELYNDGKLEKWDWKNPSVSSEVPRILHISNYGAINPGGRYPGFIGDIFGDWREEIIVTSADYDELIIFTTDIPTDRRIYTLAHNPAYRNDMTVKGYMQSHHVDYFLGHGMEDPPKPNIRYVKRRKQFT